MGTKLRHATGFGAARALTAEPLKVFEKAFKDALNSEVKLLNLIIHYMVRRRGKQWRPMLVFLTAGLHGGLTDSTYRGALLVELLHTATLLHDDVVDEASHRRGWWSINAIWKNKAAVLVGDFLLSKGLLLALKGGDYAFLRIISQTVSQMSEGELFQAQKARRLNLNEADYYRMISQKTASLLVACCEIGALSAGKESDSIMEKMAAFGHALGMAFQIRDDCLDYQTTNHWLGKPTGLDLKGRKMTLPLIYALVQSTPQQRQEVLQWVKRYGGSAKEKKRIQQFVKAKGGLAYAQKVIQKHLSEAEALLSTYSPSAYRDALTELVRANSTRLY